MQRGWKVFWAVVGFVGLVAMVSLAFVAATAARSADAVAEAIDELTGEGEFTNIGPVTVQTVRALASLTTVEFVEFTTVEKGDDRGWLNWATGDSISMLAVARIGAGVDLAQIEEADVVADPETGSAVIRLPAAEVTYIAPDTEATYVLDRSTGVFTQGDPQLERAARLAAEEILVQQAVQGGILERAEEEAISTLEALLTSLGYSNVQVVIRP